MIDRGCSIITIVIKIRLYEKIMTFCLITVSTTHDKPRVMV